MPDTHRPIHVLLVRLYSCNIKTAPLLQFRIDYSSAMFLVCTSPARRQPIHRALVALLNYRQLLLTYDAADPSSHKVPDVYADRI